MKTNLLVAGFCIGVAAVASGEVLAPAAPAPAETKYVIVDGEVVRYETGRTIAIRGTDNKEVVYTLAPSLVVPEEVKIGRRVSLYTEPGVDGKTQLVSRVTTTSVTPEGDVKRTTEDTRKLPSGATTRTTTTHVSGTVDAYEAGKTLTILRADGTKATYRIDKKSRVPAGMVTGKVVSILPVVTTGAGDPVVKTITYVTTTKTITRTETVPAH